MRSKVVLSLFLSVFLAGCNGKSQKRERVAPAANNAAANQPLNAQEQERLQQQAEEAARIQAELEAAQAELARLRTAGSAPRAEDTRRIEELQARIAELEEGQTIVQTDLGAQSIAGGEVSIAAQQSVVGGQSSVVAGVGEAVTITSGVSTTVGGESSTVGGQEAASEITKASRDAIIARATSEQLWAFAEKAIATDAPATAFAADACAADNKIYRITINAAKLKSMIELLQANQVDGSQDFFYLFGATTVPSTASVGTRFYSIADMTTSAQTNVQNRADHAWKSAILSLYLRTQTLGRAELLPVAAAMGITLEATTTLPNTTAAATASKLFVKINEKSGAACENLGTGIADLGLDQASAAMRSAMQSSIAAANLRRATTNLFDPNRFLSLTDRREVKISLLNAANAVIFSQSSKFESTLASIVATGRVANFQNATVADMGIFGAQFSESKYDFEAFVQKNAAGQVIENENRSLAFIYTYEGATQVTAAAGDLQTLSPPVISRVSHVLDATQLGRIAAPTVFTSDVRLRISTSIISRADMSALNDAINTALNTPAN